MTGTKNLLGRLVLYGFPSLLFVAYYFALYRVDALTPKVAPIATIEFVLSTLVWGTASVRARTSIILTPLSKRFDTLSELVDELLQISAGLFGMVGATWSIGAGIFLSVTGLPTDSSYSYIRASDAFLGCVFFLSPIVLVIAASVAHRRLLESAATLLQGDWDDADSLKAETAEEVARISGLPWTSDPYIHPIKSALERRERRITSLFKPLRTIRGRKGTLPAACAGDSSGARVATQGETLQAPAGGHLPSPDQD